MGQKRPERLMAVFMRKVEGDELKNEQPHIYLLLLIFPLLLLLLLLLRYDNSYNRYEKHSIYHRYRNMYLMQGISKANMYHRMFKKRVRNTGRFKGICVIQDVCKESE